MSEISRHHPPSEEQITYILSLGYRGRMPTTSFEASLVLDCLLAGLSHERTAKFEELTSMERAQGILCNAERDILNGTPLAGWRLKAIDETKLACPLYVDAFLPLDVAKQFPELLMDSNLDFSKPLQNRPWKGRIVITPSEIGEIEPRTQAPSPVTINARLPRPPVTMTDRRLVVKKPGCMGLALLILAGLLWGFVSLSLQATDGSQRPSSPLNK